MKIVVNVIPLLSPLTGVGKYTLQLTRTLMTIDKSNEYIFYNGFYSQNLRLSEGMQKKKLFNFKETIFSFPLIKKIARSINTLSFKFKKEKFDIYFEPNFIPLPIPAKRTVVTVHDFSFFHFPEWHPAERIKYFQKHFWEKIKRADKIIFDSNFIKDESIRLFSFPAEKLKTIYLGIDKNIYRMYDPRDLIGISKKYSLPPKFIFFLGSIEPRKNLKHLLLAYLNLDAPIRKEFKLVLAGFKGWKNEEIHSLIKKSNGDVKYIGYMPEEDLGKVLNLAHLFLFPSFYEGFGLPPLEAMACGCPVITSNTSSLPEICADAAFYVNPYDVNDISSAITKIICNENLKKNLIKKGLERASIFDWEISARMHLELFSEIF